MALIADVATNGTITAVWGNSIRNQTVQVTTTGALPGSPTEGMVCYCTDDHQFHVYSGSGWVDFGASGSALAWSPTITQSSSRSGTVNYGAQARIGNQVQAQLRWTCSVTGSANSIFVSGPTWTPADIASGQMCCGSALHYNGSTWATYLAIASSSGIFMQANGGSAPVSTTLASGHIIVLNLHYFV